MRCMRAEIDHDDPFVAQASAHLADAGGKRFRPLLTLLTAELGTGINDQVVAAAAGVELTHLASLYHDDVMDEADVRRGTPSANARYGNSTAILVGDLLFGKASEIVAGPGRRGGPDPGADLRAAVRRADPRRPSRPATGADPVEYYLGVLLGQDRRRSSPPRPATARCSAARHRRPST